MKKKTNLSLFNFVPCPDWTLAFYVPLTSKYLDGIFIFWVYYIVKKQNRNNEALIAAAYVVGVKFF
jgi:hypothetical protein